MEPCKKGCGALHFPGEDTRSKCCADGQGSFQKLHELDKNIKRALLTDREIKQNLRFYNTSFQMATIGSTLGGQLFAPNTFPFYIKFSGGIYHSLPPLIPRPGQNPKFVQIYILDTEMDQLNARIQNDTRNKLNKTFLSQLNELLINKNSYAQNSKKSK